MTYALALIVALCAALALTPFVIKLATRAGAMDMPGDERRVHKEPTPRWGGLAIYLAVAAAWLIAYPIVQKMPGVEYIGHYTIRSIWIMGIGGAIVAFGMLDDRYQLSALWQALFLLGCGVVLAHPNMGGIRVEFLRIPFGGEQNFIQLSELNSVLLTSVFIFVVAKTMDTIDGIDGLAAGIAAISAMAMFSLAIYMQPLIGVMSVAAVGGCLGFLKYNYHPARIFMGTGGAQFIGFFLAAISIDGLMKTAAAIALIVPLTVFGVPILDAVFVVFKRIKGRVPITQADKRHIHHALLGKGLSQQQTVWVLYAVAAVLCGVAVTLAFIARQR